MPKRIKEPITNKSTGLDLFDYDEVTDVSENFSISSVSYNTGKSHKSNDSEKNDLGQTSSIKVEKIIEEPKEKETVKLADSQDLLEEAMSKVDVTDFDPDLEDKQGESQNIQDNNETPNDEGELSGQDDSGPPLGPPPHLMPTQPGEPFPHHQIIEEEEEGGEEGEERLIEGGPNLPHVRDLAGIEQGEDEEDEEDDDEDVQAAAPEGAYDPADYEHLSVGMEIKELFSYITRYTPQAIELEHRLRPYIPDYIPAVGDIDAFIKIPRPDDEDSVIGLSVLDEPSAKQSDSTVLDLQLRAVAKHTTAKSVTVKTVVGAEKNPKVIEKWVRDISDLHRAKPPPTVHYTKRMPDIDTLMQEWPGEVEELLKEINLPNAQLEGDLSQYVNLICAIMDIPVYKSQIQSLHILFTLYSVFKNSAHFRQLAEDNYMDNDINDHLVLQ